MEIIEFIKYKRDKKTHMTYELICKVKIECKEFIFSINIKKVMKINENINKQNKNSYFIIFIKILKIRREMDLKRMILKKILKL